MHIDVRQHMCVSSDAWIEAGRLLETAKERRVNEASGTDPFIHHSA